MAQVSHRYICKLIDSFISNGNKLCLIMEYCDRGDLQQFLSRTKNMSENSALSMPIAVFDFKNAGSNQRTSILESKVWRFFVQICQALETIHA